MATKKVRAKRVSVPAPDPLLECRLFMLRIEKNLSQETVARHAGIVQSTYSRAENGQSVSVRNAKKIAKFFGKTIEEIWPN